MQNKINKDYFFRVLPKVNKFLFICVMILTVYLVGNLLLSAKSVAFNADRIMEKAALSEAGFSSQFAKLTPFKEGVFSRRSLFGPLVEKKKTREKETTFKLLGLISVGDKNAAMIRDVRAGKDYYCLGGEVIGAFTVSQILTDKVILESGDRVLEISR